MEFFQKRKLIGYTQRGRLKGNGCGHDPEKPIMNLAKGMTKSQPLVLRLLAERLQDYYWKPNKIPSLNFANGSKRQQRTERRNACYLLMVGLLKFTDITSLRVGFQKTHGFECVTLDFIAKHIGLPKNRVERAHKDLIAAKLISSTERYEKDEDGNYKGLAAVRCVSTRLFELFGLDWMLKKARKRASDKLKRIAKKEKTSRTAMVRVFNYFESQMSIKNNKTTNKKENTSNKGSDPPNSKKENKDLAETIFELASKGLTNKEIKEILAKS